jgi:uncharacterized protein (TIGR00251 family)
MSDSSILSVRVVPNKSESRIVDSSDDGTIRIEVKSQPIEGKANQELIKFLAKLLGVNKNQVIIMRGANSRNKLIKIESIEKTRILDILGRKRS